MNVSVSDYRNFPKKSGSVSKLYTKTQSATPLGATRATTPLAVTRVTTPKDRGFTSRNAGTNIISAESSQINYLTNQVAKGTTKASARQHLIAKFNNYS